jgi:hypothetical protein
MANKRRSREELKAVDALLERLREFICLNYMTAAEVAQQTGVRDTTIYDWLLGEARPAEPQRIAEFLSIGVRTLIQEEISLLTVLYFPFRERIPSSIRVQEFR